jgi:isopenicillin-N epimerase
VLHELSRYARQAISELTGLEPISPDSPELYAQMLSKPLSLCDADELKRRLYDEFRVEVPIVTWTGRQLVRVSLQGYDDRTDVDTLVRALATLLQVAKS